MIIYLLNMLLIDDDKYILAKMNFVSKLEKIKDMDSRLLRKENGY